MPFRPWQLRLPFKVRNEQRWTYIQSEPFGEIPLLLQISNGPLSRNYTHRSLQLAKKLCVDEVFDGLLCYIYWPSSCASSCSAS